MAFGSNIIDGLKKVLTLEDRIRRMDSEISELRKAYTDHEKRLIRIETMIEMGQRGGFSPRLEE